MCGNDSSLHQYGEKLKITGNIRVLISLKNAQFGTFPDPLIYTILCQLVCPKATKCHISKLENAAPEQNDEDDEKNVCKSFAPSNCVLLI